MSEPTKAAHAEPSAHFVVELSDGQYAICQRVFTLSPGAGSDFSRFISGYIKEHQVPAAILPISFDGDLCETDGLKAPLMARFQTGKLVINIDNNIDNR